MFYHAVTKYKNFLFVGVIFFPSDVIFTIFVLVWGTVNVVTVTQFSFIFIRNCIFIDFILLNLLLLWQTPFSLSISKWMFLLSWESCSDYFVCNKLSLSTQDRKSLSSRLICNRCKQSLSWFLKHKISQIEGLISFVHIIRAYCQVLYERLYQ